MTNLKINGELHTVDIDPNMPLLWVIRDIIGYTGTKFGCGKGLCGSCMILMDGYAINSCQIPASIAEGKELTTIEGQNENLQLLQKSWEEFNVPQCGFCQPGQLITATSLLNSNQNPSDTEIDSTMDRNICRCGTYPRIKKAIKHVIQQKNND